VVLSDGSERALLLGDVAHCPMELTDVQWARLADVDPALAAQTREALAREAEGGGALVGAAHFHGLRFGRLLNDRHQRRSWAIDKAMRLAY
jgi:hypothetical protein